MNHSRIKDYRIMVANVEGEPSDQDFTEVKKGTLANQQGEQEIVLNEAVPATHVRLVATSSSYIQNNSTGHVAAQRIRVFEEVEVTGDLKNHADFWDSEMEKGTMSTQEDSDMWHYQVRNKQSGQWVDLPAEAFNTDKWMGVAVYASAKMAKSEFNCKLAGQEGSKYSALAYAWKAPRDGYYKVPQMSLTEAWGNGANGFIKYSPDMTDGVNKWTGRLYKTTTLSTNIIKMSQGQWIRFGAEAINREAGVQGYNPTVQEMNASDYATQWLPEVERTLTSQTTAPESVVNKAKALKDDLTQKVNAADKNEQEIDALIKELEVALDHVVNYVAVNSITLNHDTLQLKVNGEETLQVTFNPTNATEQAVTWESNNQTVAEVTEGKVTAKAPGQAVITVTSTAHPDKTATCTVNVEADVNKGDLKLALDEAKGYVQTDYTAASWALLQDAITEATKVYESQEATQQQVNDAVSALMEAVSSLEREYKVTVDGAQVSKGVYNTIVTINAPQAPEGQKFAGWDLNGVVVSTNPKYTFAITGDMNFTAKFMAAESEVVVQPQALLNSVQMKVLSNGRFRVEFTNQIIVPKGYSLEDTGLAFTKDKSLTSLHNEDGVLKDSRVRTLTTRTVNVNGQYKVAINNVPKGANVYTEVYAKLKTPTGEFVWVYSPLQTTTVK